MVGMTCSIVTKTHYMRCACVCVCVGGKGNERTGRPDPKTLPMCSGFGCNLTAPYALKIIDQTEETGMADGHPQTRLATAPGQSGS